MMPDRTIALDKRVVHDQRRVNMATDKTWHPPALQPTHQQVARRVLWYKSRYPGIEVVISKRDIAGAFRLLWVAPEDVHLFAGDLPWKPDMMNPDETGGDNPTAMDSLEGEDITVLYLVSSFGFSGSPGGWTAFGRANCKEMELRGSTARFWWMMPFWSNQFSACVAVSRRVATTRA